MTDEEWAQEKAMNKLGIETRNFRADGTNKHTLENQKRYAYKAADWSEGSYHDQMRKAADAKRKKYGTTTTYNGY